MKYKNDIYRMNKFGNLGQSAWDAEIEAPLWQWIAAIAGVAAVVIFIIKVTVSA